MIFHFIFRLYEIKETKLNVKLCEKSVKRKQKNNKEKKEKLKFIVSIFSVSKRNEQFELEV